MIMYMMTYTCVILEYMTYDIHIIYFWHTYVMIMYMMTYTCVVLMCDLWHTHHILVWWHTHVSYLCMTYDIHIIYLWHTHMLYLCIWLMTYTSYTYDIHIHITYLWHTHTWGKWVPSKKTGTNQNKNDIHIYYSYDIHICEASEPLQRRQEHKQKKWHTHMLYLCCTHMWGKRAPSKKTEKKKSHVTHTYVILMIYTYVRQESPFKVSQKDGNTKKNNPTPLPRVREAHRWSFLRRPLLPTQPHPRTYIHTHTHTHHL